MRQARSPPRTTSKRSLPSDFAVRRCPASHRSRTSRCGRALRGESTGTEVKVHGGAVAAVRELGVPEGTCIEVADLFYNLPARRKFLKSDTAESTQISRLVTQMALGYPNGRLLADQRTAQATRMSAGRRARRAFLSAVRRAAGSGRDPQGGGRHQDSRFHRGARRPGTCSRPSKRLRQPPHRQGPHYPQYAISEAYSVATIKERSPQAHLFIDIPRELRRRQRPPDQAAVRFLEQSLVHEVLRRGLGEALGQGRAPELQFTPFAAASRRAADRRIPGVLAGAIVGNRWAAEQDTISGGRDVRFANPPAWPPATGSESDPAVYDNAGQPAARHPPDGAARAVPRHLHRCGGR